jgi:lipoate synthase
MSAPGAAISARSIPARPATFDASEPLRVAESVQTMALRYATVTGVCRDDLPDEGAWLYAETIRRIHELNPDTGVEMLAPDFLRQCGVFGSDLRHRA